jgi:hypothetical protein
MKAERAPVCTHYSGFPLKFTCEYFCQSHQSGCLSSNYPHGSCLPPTATPNTPFNTGTGSDATSSSHNTLYGRFRVDDCDGCTRPFLPASLQAFQANVSTRGRPRGFREAIKLCLPHRRGEAERGCRISPWKYSFGEANIRASSSESSSSAGSECSMLACATCAPAAK